MTVIFAYYAAIKNPICAWQGLALLCMARPLSDAVVIETQSDWGYSLGTAEGWKGATGEIAGKAPEPLNPWGSDA